MIIFIGSPSALTPASTTALPVLPQSVVAYGFICSSSVQHPLRPLSRITQGDATSAGVGGDSAPPIPTAAAA